MTAKLVFLLSFLFSLATSLNSSFSQTNLYVSFHSRVSASNPLLGQYEEADVLPLIRKISTRFSRILTDGVSLQSGYRSIELISTATAKLNKETNSSLKLMIAYKYENFTDINGKRYIPFDIALELAEKSNQLFKGTVDTLILWDEFGESVSDLTQHFQYAKSKVKKQSIQNKYRHGIAFKEFVCGIDFDRTYYQLLENIGFVYFNFQPNTQTEYNLGPEESFSIYKKRFEFCRAKFNKYFPAVEVGMGLVWPDTDYSGHQNYSELVLFWTKVNEYVLATNTTVIMFEAFDNPLKDSIWKNMGWWKLKNPDKYYERGDELIFLEKRDLSLNEMFKNKTVHGSESLYANLFSGNNSTIILVVGLFLLTVAVMGTIISIAYWRIWRKLENHETQLLKDIREFFEGSDNSELNQSPLQYELNCSVQNSKYDTKYELKSSSFEIYEKHLLGMGNFGVVCKGRVKVLNEYVETAVKMVRKSCPPTALKGLLSEIKVLSHLGQNENIACLIGAYTKDLKNGKVLVFTELCELGSLESFLRKEAKSATILGEERRRQMLRWSFEIASGMECIISKVVIHADLSTRNVLLTNNFTAKISDFGLSRRLYDYTSYVKKSQEPLPWRWMSPESLRRWEFTEKSDVWAYGVTLWEIYSLGVLPYGGFSWTIDFPCKLVQGLRLEEPEFNADNMYEFMLKCWSVEPEERPTFLQLKEILSTQEFTKFIKNSSQNEVGDDACISQSKTNYMVLKEYQK